MLSFITQLETLWSSMIKGEYASLLNLQQHQADGTSKSSPPSNSRKHTKNFPAELSSKLTHQITQITVFYQLNQSKDGFRVPTKRVSHIAQIAKQIVIQDRINIPR